jgi:hypothetical protein
MHNFAQKFGFSKAHEAPDPGPDGCEPLHGPCVASSRPHSAVWSPALPDLQCCRIYWCQQ